MRCRTLKTVDFSCGIHSQVHGSLCRLTLYVSCVVASRLTGPERPRKEKETKNVSETGALASAMTLTTFYMARHPWSQNVWELTRQRLPAMSQKHKHNLSFGSDFDLRNVDRFPLPPAA